MRFIGLTPIDKYYSSGFFCATKTTGMQNETVSEFFKLDSVDKKTLFWLMDNKPEEIKSWINHVVKHYNRPEKNLINAERLYEEIREDLV